MVIKLAIFTAPGSVSCLIYFTSYAVTRQFVFQIRCLNEQLIIILPILPRCYVRKRSRRNHKKGQHHEGES
jgi:hypothetical protein